MKRILPICLILIVSAATQAQTNFFDGTYQEAFAMAQKQNKYLFVDCYTDWCGWCKVADKKTFPAEEVADVLNENFVCVKVDMERGKGVYLGMKYRVTGYPSYLMFTPDGSLAHKMSGYIKDPSDFTNEVKMALDENNRSAYPSKLLDNVEFPGFYREAFTDRDIEHKRANPEPEEVAAWLNRQKDLTTEAAWSVMYRFALNQELTQKFLDNRESYIRKYGSNEVQNKISGIANQKLRKAMKTQDEADLLLVMDFADQYSDENKEERKTYYKLKFSEGKGDWSEYAVCAQGMIDFHGLENHLEGINNYSWTIYLNADRKEVLKTAIGWMDEVVRLDPLYMYLDTYAALLFKSGHYEEAIDWADKAINTGKQNGENVKETEELIDQIIAAKEGK